MTDPRSKRKAPSTLAGFHSGLIQAEFKFGKFI